MATVKPTQSLRLGDLQFTIERYLDTIVDPGSTAKVQIGPLLKRWIAIGLASDVKALPKAKRKRIGSLPEPERPL